MSAMAGMKLSERTIKIMVVSLSIAGVMLLLLLARISEVEYVDLSDLEDHNGGTVRTSGLIIGQDMTSNGACRLLLTDGNDTVEVYIERSEDDYPPGTEVEVTGDVYSSGGTTTLTVQSDSGIEEKGRLENTTLEPGSKSGTMVSFGGNIVSISPWGWDDDFLTIMVSEEDRSFFIDVTASRMDQDLRCGDLISITGFIMDEDHVICYGDPSLELLFRPESEATSLLGLLDRLEDDPANIPTGKMDIDGYVKYEPTGRSVYISDEPEGTSISVKTVLPEPDPMLHKGDLITLVNSTLLWDPEDLRYSISAEWAYLVSPHGPWRIRLDNLEYGVSSYEDCSVIVEGEPVRENERCYLVCGPARIEIRDGSGIVLGRTIEIAGNIRFDPIENTYFLEPAEVMY